MFNKLKKLRLMKGDEILYRVRERYRRETDRVRFHLDLGINSDREFDTLLQRYGFSVKNYLNFGPAGRFYVSTQNRETVSDLIREEYPDWLERIVADADYIS